MFLDNKEIILGEKIKIFFNINTSEIKTNALFLEFKDHYNTKHNAKTENFQYEEKIYLNKIKRSILINKIDKEKIEELFLFLKSLLINNNKFFYVVISKNRDINIFLKFLIELDYHLYNYNIDKELLKLEKNFKKNSTQNKIWNFFILNKELLNISQFQTILLQIKNYIDYGSIYRNLVNTPANLLTPSHFVSLITKTLKKNIDKTKLKLKVISKEELLKNNLRTLVSVGKNLNETFLLHAEYHNDKNFQNISLIGKGISFDSGGLNLKIFSKMYGMKYDMCGAALSFVLFLFLIKKKFPANFSLTLPICENSIGLGTNRPGDIIKSYSNKSIEIINTDAEGRLILADAISYNEYNFKPNHLLTFSTLTGLTKKYFDTLYIPILCNTKFLSKIFNFINKQDNFFQEKTFLMPFDHGYAKLLKTKIADIKNLSLKAGSITAGFFLYFFLKNKNISFIHFDIAGVAIPDNNYLQNKYWGLETILELIKKLI